MKQIDWLTKNDLGKVIQLSHKHKGVIQSDTDAGTNKNNN